MRASRAPQCSAPHPARPARLARGPPSDLGASREIRARLGRRGVANLAAIRLPDAPPSPPPRRKVNAGCGGPARGEILGRGSLINKTEDTAARSAARDKERARAAR